MGRKLDRVIEFKVDDGACGADRKARVRGDCRGQKPRPTTTLKRSRPGCGPTTRKRRRLIGYYFKSGNLTTIDGLAPVESVTKAIEKALK